MGAVFTVTFLLTESGIKYTIASEKLPEADYLLNEKGLYAAIFDKIRKSVSPLSNLTIGSEVYWNISRQHLGESGSDCFFILNTNDQIIESPGSNVYVVRGNRVIGAGAEQGAYQDVTRSFLLEIFKNLHLDYSESNGILLADILAADEIFLADSINGIRWIVGFEGKRYYNQTIRQISGMFSRNLV